MMAAMEPPRWRAVAASISSPAVVATGDRGAILFARSETSELVVLRYDGMAWSEPRSLGIPLAQVPGSRPQWVPIDWPIAACASGVEVHLLARGAEGELAHGTLRDEHWSGFECIGSPANWIGGIAVPMGLASAPTACSRAPDQMDVFAIGSAGALLHSFWDGTQFTEFESLGGVARDGREEEPLSGSISASACGPNAMVVVARGAAGDLVAKRCEGSIWGPFISLGTPQEPDRVYPAVPCPVPLAGAPIACGGGPSRLDVFARGQRGDLLHRWWDEKNWSAFESLGLPRSEDGQRLPFTAGPIAGAWGRFRLHLVARGSDTKMHHLAWSGIGEIALRESGSTTTAD